jgi:hypothetical protein
MARAGSGAKTKAQGKATKNPAAAKPAKAAASRAAKPAAKPAVKPAAKPAPGPEARLSVAAALLRKNARRIGA